MSFIAQADREYAEGKGSDRRDQPQPHPEDESDYDDEVAA
jgi:hypothetical protein